MKRRSEKNTRESVRNKLIGLGELSMRKSYYPELKDRVEELEKFRALIEQARDVLFVIEAPSGYFADVNWAAIRKTGYSRQQLLESRVHDVLPDDKCGLLGLLDTAGQIGKDEAGHGFCQTELIAANGSRIPVEMTVRRHVVGGKTYLVIVARDVTKRLKAEDDLRRTRNYLGNVIDSLKSILVGVDSEMRVVLWNDYAQSVTGISSDEAEGKPVTQLLPELVPFEHLILRTIREKFADEKEMFRQEREGGTAFFELMIYSFAGDDEDGAVIRIDDITARIRMEEVMMQTEKMMTVGGLAAGMAHEINNPLSGIMQSSQNVIRRISSGLNKNSKVAEECGTTIEAIQSYCERRGILGKLESIHQMGERAAKIVANMLHFSRKSKESKEQASLETIVEAALELSVSDYDMYKKYGFRELDVYRDYSPQACDVLCNSSEIEQVVINLVKNAAQAMSKYYFGEKPWISARIEPAGSIVRLVIEDNGPGMTEEVRKKAIEPFFTTKEVGEGTGLGLFVSYFIITQKHGGNFNIASMPGRGTKIQVELPCA